MPSCRQSDPFRVKPWLAHTPQPDDPPPDQPGTPDVPPVGDPPPQPAEVPRSIDPRFYPAMRVAPFSDKHTHPSHELAREQQAHIARIAQRAGRAAWARWARWAGWICHVELGAQQAAECPSDVDARVRSRGGAACGPRMSRAC